MKRLCGGKVLEHLFIWPRYTSGAVPETRPFNAYFALAITFFDIFKIYMLGVHLRNWDLGVLC